MACGQAFTPSVQEINNHHMFRVQILHRPGQWFDYAAPGGEPDLWTGLDEARQFAEDFIARHQNRRPARVVNDDGGEVVWPDPGPPAAAALARVSELLERLGGARRHHEGGFAFRLPTSWRPSSLHALAQAELTPHGYAVALQGSELHVRYAGEPLAAAEKLLAVCRRVNRQFGRGTVTRLEFLGPDRGHAVIEVGRGREEFVPFAVSPGPGLCYLNFLDRTRQVR
jgi:hypothetical protein